MPQELHALQCSECATYQVHIVKKTPKWTCKICGTKQCVQKIFAQGTGQSCRQAVQILNQKRILEELPNLQEEVRVSDCRTKSACLPLFLSESSTQKISKWSEFCTPAEANAGESNQDNTFNCLPQITKSEKASIPSNEKNAIIKPSYLEGPLCKKGKFEVDTKIFSVNLKQQAKKERNKITKGIFEDDDDFNLDKIEL